MSEQQHNAAVAAKDDSAEIARLREELCPECGKPHTDGLVYGADHFGVCDACKVYWLMAGNEFNAHPIDEASWLAHTKKLFQKYREVAPIPKDEIARLRQEIEKYFSQLWELGTYNDVMWLVDEVMGFTREYSGSRDLGLKALGGLARVARREARDLAHGACVLCDASSIEGGTDASGYYGRGNICRNCWREFSAKPASPARNGRSSSRKWSR